MKYIQLTQWQITLVDDGDFEWLSQWKWHAQWDPDTKSYYAVRSALRGDGKQELIRMHRVILGLGPGELGDHKDHDTLNNRRDNLRRCTHSQNMANGRRQSNNTSGFKGVRFDTECNKWRAEITFCSKKISLGFFDDITAAARAYDAAARQHFGEFAHCNFMDNAEELSR